MPTSITAAILAVSIFASADAAMADTIDFSQFGAPGAVLGNVLEGVTTGGVDFTITGAGFGFSRRTANDPVPPAGWSPSQFVVGAPLLYDGNTVDEGPGAVSIVFASPISSITSLAAEPSNYGSYTATLTAYDGATLLGSVSYSEAGVEYPAGTIGSLNFFAPEITSIVIDTTNDGTGFALGTVVPETSTWAMMLLGFAGLGFAGYRRGASARA
jgi:hypothetical protein